MTSFLTNRANTLIHNQQLDLLNDTLKWMLVYSSFTPDIDADFVSGSGASAAEVTGAGYTGGFAGAGRLTISGKSIVEVDGSDRSIFDCASPSWPGLNLGIVAYALVIKEVTTDADSELVIVADVANIQTTGLTYSLTVNATFGLLNLVGQVT